MSAPMSEARSLHMIEPVASRLEGTPREVRRWSDEFKAQAVVEAMQPSTNISTVAHRIGIDPSRYSRGFAMRAGKLRHHPRPHRGMVCLHPKQQRSDDRDHHLRHGDPGGCRHR
ncbi:transposase [Sinorhizobium medicae]|nr:transposase [Sinorhizobium medicae]MDX0748233.1 transposase [Sinorhizobium medicae]